MPRKSAAVRSAAPTDAPATIVSRLLEIPIPSIVESVLDVRRHAPPSDPEFVADVREHGVLNAILVRPYRRSGASTDDMYELVAGRRRFRAAKEVGFATIPAQVRDVTDLVLLKMAFSENVKRRDMSPLDEADALVKMQALDPLYVKPEVLGSFIGRSASYVRDRLKLNKLVELVREALEAGAITTKHAELIGTLPADQHAEALAKCFPDWADLDDSGKSTPIAKLVEKRDWVRLAPQLLGTRDLARWARDHGKADLDDETVQLQLVDELQDGEKNASTFDIAAAAKSLAQLSTDDWLSDGEIKALGVLPTTHWRKVGKGPAHRCEHTKRGAPIHGMKFGRDGKRIVIFDVCCEKTCKKHWPELNRPKTATTPVRSTASKPSASEAAARKREAKATAERKASAATWEKDEAIYRLALGALLTKTKADPVAYVKSCIHNDVKTVEQDYGIKLTPATALHVLELADFYSGDRLSLLSSAKSSFGITPTQLEAEFKKRAPKPAAEKKAPAAKKKGGAKK